MDISHLVQNTNLLPEEDCSWNEEDVPLEKRGVSLSWLVNFFYQVDRNLTEVWKRYDEQYRASEYFDGVPVPDKPEIKLEPWTTATFVENIIIPLTKKEKTPLYARVPMGFRGKPTMFLSHTWSQNLELTLNITQQPMQINEMKRRNIDWSFIWIDIACYNQHLFESISEDMKYIISSIGFVGIPMLYAGTFSRLWCIWEFLCAYITKSEIQFLEVSSSSTDQGRAYEYFVTTFRSIADASTTLQKDKVQILDAIVKTFGSIEAADKYFLELTDKGLTQDKWKPRNKQRH